LEQFPYGLAVVGRDRAIVYMNRRARQLVMPADPRQAGSPWTCCDLICNRLGPLVGTGCIVGRTAVAGGELPEVRMDIDQERLQTAAWVTASPLRGGAGQTLVHLRPGRPGDRRRRTPPEWSGHASEPDRSRLQITTLGRFRVEGSSGPIDGDWLDQRPGQLLKYMVKERRRVVSNDQIAEALWPEAAPSEGRNRLRHYVHALREKLEPGRERRSTARFIVARRGAYCFDTREVWIDADEFERETRAALATLEQGLLEAAGEHLARAMRVYQGNFLAEDPYAEWVLDERERLRELAGRALRGQVRIQMKAGSLEIAAEHARRLVEMEPYDGDAQRLVISLCLKRGRRSEAHRRYSVLCKRLMSQFGQRPDFELSDLEGRSVSAAP
jgi:DNA-binding SARP family transcriptional activator